MRKLLSILKWIASHVHVRQRDLNEGDPDAKPKPAFEIGIGGTF